MQKNGVLPDIQSHKSLAEPNLETLEFERLRFLKNKRAGYILLVIYFFVGLLIYKDYGVPVDTHSQLRHSRVNYRYIINFFESKIKSDNTRKFIERTQDLNTYGSKHYGVALQLLPVAIEHINDFQMDISNVLLLRSLYIFINYVFGCLCFYLILRKRFGDNYIPLVGLLMLILYPRFFGPAFFDIKNLMFVAWYTISTYFALKFIETPSIKNMLLFSFTVAISTNTRVVGISIVLLVIAFYIFYTVREIYQKGKYSKDVFNGIITLLLLLISFFGFYTFITPASWSNPIRFFIDTIIKFAYFDNWNGTHLFMGDLISKDVPWYYVPVWMAITIPVVYTLFFYYGSFVYFVKFMKNIKKLFIFLDIKNMMDLFMLSAIWCSLIGFILINAYFYVDWHHTYFLFIPFLYLAVLGLSDILIRFHYKKPVVGIISLIMIWVLASNAIWIIRNHPYQATYFNIFMRKSAVYNFERETYRTFLTDLFRYILSIDDRDKISTSLGTFHNILPKEMRDRFSTTSYQFGADYLLLAARGRKNNDWKSPGYKEIYNISVDGYKLAALKKYLIRENMFTVDSNFKLIPENPQKIIGSVEYEFDEIVSYNLFRLHVRDHRRSYPRNLRVFTSIDGDDYKEVKIIWNNRVDYILEDREYKYIRFIKNNDEIPWVISSIKTGHIHTNEINEIVNP